MNSMFLNAAAAVSLLFERVRKRRAFMVRALSVIMQFMIACLSSAASTCLSESVIIILKVNIRLSLSVIASLTEAFWFFFVSCLFG